MASDAGGQAGGPDAPHTGGKQAIHQALRHYREKAGATIDHVSDVLVVGPGWVQAWECGEQEPPLAMLNQLLTLHGVSLAHFFETVALDEPAIANERNLVAQDTPEGLRLHFPMGNHRASVLWPTATAAQANTVLAVLRKSLSTGGEGTKTAAVVTMFLEAVTLWPDINPSDLWTFFVSHAYQDRYNHHADNAGGDLGQSWKRTSGWAFERILSTHYNPVLQEHDIWLEIPNDARKRELLEPMSLSHFAAAMRKADVLAVGRSPQGEEHCFGVIHAKTSLAERRTDDVPLSRELLQRGFVSPLVTMDCKASPSEHPQNRGEYGVAQGGDAEVSQKRLDVERDNMFDAAFSYNANTVPTPAGAAAAARIHVVDFSNPDDVFSQHLVNKWKARHGLL